MDPILAGIVAVLLIIFLMSAVFDYFSGNSGGSALRNTRNAARNEFDRQADGFLRDVSRHLGRRR